MVCNSIHAERLCALTFSLPHNKGQTVWGFLVDAHENTRLRKLKTPSANNKHANNKS